MRSDKDRSVVNLNVIINIHRFSSKRKLLCVTARALKFVRLLRKEGQEMPREIEASDIKEAERKWIRSTQEQLFPEEVKSLRARKTVLYSNQFILFLQDNIIRCRGRINEASLPCHAKNPILLPEKHYFSELVLGHNECGLYPMSRWSNTWVCLIGSSSIMPDEIGQGYIDDSVEGRLSVSKQLGS